MKDLMTSVREILSTTPERWCTLAGSVDADLLARRPSIGEWSAVECLQHVLDTEIGAFGVRIEAFLEGRDLTAFDPDAAGMRPEPTSDAAVLAARFAETRARNLTALERVGNADLERSAGHPEYGRVTLREMLNEWAAHDLMHMVQAERALMQPFIVGSGKWRDTFAAHDAASPGS